MIHQSNFYLFNAGWGGQALLGGTFEKQREQRNQLSLKLKTTKNNMRQILKLLPFLTEQNGQTWKRWQETESNRYTWSSSEVDWIHDTRMLKNPHRE